MPSVGLLGSHFDRASEGDLPVQFGSPALAAHRAKAEAPQQSVNRSVPREGDGAHRRHPVISSALHDLLAKRSADTHAVPIVHDCNRELGDAGPPLAEYISADANH